MPAKLTVVGIHPVAADEPCHLVELVAEGLDADLDFGEITQEVAGQPRSNWQAPWDERLLEEAEGKARFAFFFHYLDLSKPLVTPLGPVPLPRATEMPAHLSGINYEAP